MKSPFKFLDAYTREDREIFFGRDREIEELYQKVFESNVLLVCGMSGTGKTSLINCGLANKFEDSDWLPVNIRRGNEITSSLKAGISKASITPVRENQSVTRQLQSIYLDHFKPIYLIFDQFEEVFIFGNREERKELIKEVKKIIDSDVQCKLLFVLREEYLAGAIEFEKEIPTFLTNRIRIEKMTWSNARQVIEEPCRAFGIEVEEGLSEKILGKLSPESTQVELTYLQVLLDKMYRLSNESDKPGFTTDLLNKLGDVSDMLGSFLEEQINQLDDSETGLAVLKSFVTVKGTKRQVTHRDISDVSSTLGKEISENDLKNLIEKFINLRILRDKDESGRYELRHDSLATKIYEKITLYEKELLEVRHFLDNALNNYEKRNKLLGTDDLEYIAPYEKKLFISPGIAAFIEASRREAQKSKIRRRRLVSSIAIALIIILTGFTIWALNERRKAVLHSQIAEEQKNLAVKANLETEKAREQAIEEKLNAEESEQIAIKERQEAILANEAAEIAKKQALAQKNRAEESEILALNARNEAERLRELAEEEKVRADEERQLAIQNYKKAKASNLLIRARNFENQDPTVALGLAEYAWELDQSDYATTTIEQIYRKNNFYKIIGQHRYPVTSVDFSPDGKTILTGSDDNTACLRNLDGNLIRQFAGHKDDVTSVKFSPAGDKVITGSKDMTACLWSISGELIQTFRGHDNTVTSVAFSPDGKYILTGSEDHKIQLWDLNGRMIRTYTGSEYPVNEVEFSPDGNYIIAGYAGNIAWLYDFNGRKMETFVAGAPDVYLEDGSPGENDVLSVAIAPDRQAVISGSKDKTARVFNFTGNSILEIGGHPGSVTSVLFTPDGNKIITGSSDNIIRLWDMNGELLQEYRGHRGAVNDLAFSPDGLKMISGSGDNTVRLWDFTANTRFEWKAHDIATGPLAYSPDGKYILTGSLDNTACLWDMEGNKLATFQGHNDVVSGVLFIPDGSDIITSAVDGSVHFWTRSGIEKITWNHESPVISINISSDGELILTGSADKAAYLWNRRGDLIHTLGGHQAGVGFVAFSPDQKMAITADISTIRLWDLSGNLISRLDRPSGSYIHSIDLSPDGNFLLTAEGTAAYLIDQSGRVVQSIPIPDEKYLFLDVAFAPDGNNFFCAGNSTIFVYDYTGNLLQVIEEDDGSGRYWNDIKILKCSPDGSNLISSHEDGSVYIHYLKMPLEKFREEGHYEAMNTYQKLQFDILDYSEMDSLKGKKALLEAAAYFLDETDKSNDEETKIDYLLKAGNLYDEILSSDPDEYIWLGKARVIARLMTYGTDRKKYEMELEEIYDQLILSGDVNILLDCAELNQELSAGSFDDHQKILFANNAIRFYEKLLENNPGKNYLKGLIESLIQLNVFDPSEGNNDKLESTFNEFLSAMNEMELHENAKYFLDLADKYSDHEYKIAYLSKSVLLFERILEFTQAVDVRNYAGAAYNNLSLAQLFTRQFKKAINNAEKGLEISDDIYLYTKLSLAYLLDNQYDEAIAIIERNKDRKLRQGLFQDYMIGKMNELEAAGIEHPDFDKVRELLNE